MSLGNVVDRGAEVAVAASRKTLDVGSAAIVWTVRKTWRPVAKVTLGVTAFLFASHNYCPVYLRQEQAAATVINSAFLEVAGRYGIEARPLIEPKVDHVAVVEKEAIRNGFSESYGRTVVSHESHFDPRAKSPRGAIGLMQIMPANAKGCGLRPEELWEPQKNVACGFKLLRASFNKYHDARKALIAYNGGDEGVRVVTKCGDNVPCMGGFDESYYYARDILNDTATDMRG